MSKTMTEGRQCGGVRYVATIADGDAYSRHSRMCQGTTGGFAAAFVQGPAGVLGPVASRWRAAGARLRK